MPSPHAEVGMQQRGFLFNQIWCALENTSGYIHHKGVTRSYVATVLDFPTVVKHKFEETRIHVTIAGVPAS